MTRKMSKQTVAIIALAILLALCLTFSVTYAYFTATATSSTSGNLKTGTLVLSLGTTQTSIVNNKVTPGDKVFSTIYMSTKEGYITIDESTPIEEGRVYYGVTSDGYRTRTVTAITAGDSADIPWDTSNDLANGAINPNYGFGGSAQDIANYSNTTEGKEGENSVVNSRYQKIADLDSSATYSSTNPTCTTQETSTGSVKVGEFLVRTLLTDATKISSVTKTVTTKYTVTSGTAGTFSSSAAANPAEQIAVGGDGNEAVIDTLAGDLARTSAAGPKLDAGGKYYVIPVTKLNTSTNDLGQRTAYQDVQYIVYNVGSNDTAEKIYNNRATTLIGNYKAGESRVGANGGYKTAIVLKKSAFTGFAYNEMGTSLRTQGYGSASESQGAGSPNAANSNISFYFELDIAEGKDNELNLKYLKRNYIEDTDVKLYSTYTNAYNYDITAKDDTNKNNNALASQANFFNTYSSFEKMGEAKKAEGADNTQASKASKTTYTYGLMASDQDKASYNTNNGYVWGSISLDKNTPNGEQDKVVSLSFTTKAIQASNVYFVSYSNGTKKVSEAATVDKPYGATSEGYNPYKIYRGAYVYNVESGSWARNDAGYGFVDTNGSYAAGASGIDFQKYEVDAKLGAATAEGKRNSYVKLSNYANELFGYATGDCQYEFRGTTQNRTIYFHSGDIVPYSVYEEMTDTNRANVDMFIALDNEDFKRTRAASDNSAIPATYYNIGKGSYNENMVPTIKRWSIADISTEDDSTLTSGEAVDTAEDTYRSTTAPTTGNDKAEDKADYYYKKYADNKVYGLTANKTNYLDNNVKYMTLSYYLNKVLVKPVKTTYGTEGSLTPAQLSQYHADYTDYLRLSTEAIHHAIEYYYSVSGAGSIANSVNNNPII